MPTSARARPNVAQALTALDEIENCIVATSALPRREAEVSARILYGLSSVGIALDLSVSEETVKTYRKRAYQRLAIGSERELLTWYLARWSRWRGHRFELTLSARCTSSPCDGVPRAGTARCAERMGTCSRGRHAAPRAQADPR